MKNPSLGYRVVSSKKGVIAVLSLINLPCSLQKQDDWYHTISHSRQIHLNTCIGHTTLAVMCQKQANQALPTREEMIDAVQARYFYDLSWIKDIHNWPEAPPIIVKTDEEERPLRFANNVFMIPKLPRRVGTSRRY